MLLIPVVVLVAVGLVTWSLLQHRHHAVAGADGPSEAVHHRQTLPTTPFGWVGFATGILVIVNAMLVNVVQTPFLNIGLVLAATASTALARLVQHDRSTVVLVILAASAVSLLGSLLFVAGEVFIGHD